MANLKLEDIRIATPCDADWDEMKGDDRKRFCGSCEKNVFNISDMTRREAETFLEDNVGKSICVQLYKRHDGTVLSDDCPMGLRKIRDRLRLMKATAAIFLSFIISAVFSSVRAQSVDGPIKGKVAMPMPVVKGERMPPAVPMAGGMTPMRGDWAAPPAAQTTTSARIVGAKSKWSNELKSCITPAMAELKKASPNRDLLKKTSTSLQALAKKCEDAKQFESAAVSLNNAANCEFYAGNYAAATNRYKDALNALSKADQTFKTVLRPTITENILAVSAAINKSAACGPGVAWLQTELGGASYTAAPPVVSSGITD